MRISFSAEWEFQDLMLVFPKACHLDHNLIWSLSFICQPCLTNSWLVAVINLLATESDKLSFVFCCLCLWQYVYSSAKIPTELCLLVCLGVGKPFCSTRWDNLICVQYWCFESIYLCRSFWYSILHQVSEVLFPFGFAAWFDGIL